MRVGCCYVCSSPVWPGHGNLFVRNDAKQFQFCRSKCRKTFQMKRNPRRLRWTKAYRKATGKEMVVDTTFAFERKKNRAEKYDREVMAKSLKAMPVITKIKRKREKDWHKRRMVVSIGEERKAALFELNAGIDLVAPVIVREKQKAEKVEKEKQKEQVVNEVME